MTLSELLAFVREKQHFTTLSDYIGFCERYLDFVKIGLQAVIIAQNEHHYQFYQYRDDGHYNITRPLNSKLMYSIADIATITDEFVKIMANVQDIPETDTVSRRIIIRSIYTLQQCIGTALDALPAGQANRARKVNGDLFERLIQLLIRKTGVRCDTGTIQVPVEVDGEVQFKMKYQHDLLLYDDHQLRVIGSVKTSSKDRIDKIFMDKFMYSRLTDTALPHIAIFLNDVQRKKTRRANQYSISATFLPGHFKGFTIKLNPMDGVYYCDIRPNMRKDAILKTHIQTIDQFFCTDLWRLLAPENP